jgi:hypothetical protein
MDYITEFAKEIVDRYLKAKGWDPRHVDRNRRMAMTKTKEFQLYAQRMGEAMEFPQGDFDAKGTSAKVVGEKNLSKSAQLVKSIYKKHRIKEELYDHEKDDKDGTTYGKKPKLSANKQETDQQGQSDSKTQAAAVLSGGTTLTGQKRDVVEIDPVLKKSKPGSPNGEVGDTKQ